VEIVTPVEQAELDLVKLCLRQACDYIEALASRGPFDETCVQCGESLRTHACSSLRDRIAAFRTLADTRAAGGEA
jgi:hypothetical protein